MPARPERRRQTTTLLTIAGELAPVDGLVMFGNVPTFTPMYQRVRNGIGLVTEERLVFTKMSTRDNLRIGGGSVERALELFPDSSRASTCAAACCRAASSRWWPCRGA